MTRVIKYRKRAPYIYEQRYRPGRTTPFCIYIGPVYPKRRRRSVNDGFTGGGGPFLPALPFMIAYELISGRGVERVRVAMSYRTAWKVPGRPDPRTIAKMTDKELEMERFYERCRREDEERIAHARKYSSPKAKEYKAQHEQWLHKWNEQRHAVDVEALREFSARCNSPGKASSSASEQRSSRGTSQPAQGRTAEQVDADYEARESARQADYESYAEMANAEDAAAAK